MPRANGQTLQALTNAFNSSCTKVHVNLVVQTSYNDTWQGGNQAGLTNGELPDVVQLQDTDTQGAVDTHRSCPSTDCFTASTTRPVTSCPGPRLLEPRQAQQAMPFAVSGPVLYYNKLAFQKAGLDPAEAAGDPGRPRDDREGAEDGGAGIPGLGTPTSVLRDQLATTANQVFVNNANGRSARGDQGRSRQPTGTQVFNYLDGAAPYVGGHQLGKRRRRLRPPARCGFRQVLHGHRHLAALRHGGAGTG